MARERRMFVRRVHVKLNENNVRMKQSDLFTSHSAVIYSVYIFLRIPTVQITNLQMRIQVLTRAVNAGSILVFLMSCIRLSESESPNESNSIPLDVG